MIRLLPALCLTGCAAGVWNFRQMDCTDGQQLDLGDGETRPLVVRSTCDGTTDEECVLKLEGLGQAYTRATSDQLYVDEVEAIEVEARFFPNIRMEWGRADRPADIEMTHGGYALRIEGGPERVPEGAQLAYARLHTTGEDAPRMDVSCVDCAVDAVAPRILVAQLAGASSAHLCVDDPSAEVELLVAGATDVHLYLPAGAAVVRLETPMGEVHDGLVLIHGSGEPNDFVQTGSTPPSWDDGAPSTGCAADMGTFACED